MFVGVLFFFSTPSQHALATTLGVFSEYEERKNASKEVRLERRLSFWTAFGRGATAKKDPEPAAQPDPAQRQRQRRDLIHPCVMRVFGCE